MPSGAICGISVARPRPVFSDDVYRKKWRKFGISNDLTMKHGENNPKYIQLYSNLGIDIFPNRDFASKYWDSINKSGDFTNAYHITIAVFHYSTNTLLMLSTNTWPLPANIQSNHPTWGFCMNNLVFQMASVGHWNDWHQQTWGEATCKETVNQKLLLSSRVKKGFVWQ